MSNTSYTLKIPKWCVIDQFNVIHMYSSHKLTAEAHANRIATFDKKRTYNVIDITGKTVILQIGDTTNV